jgi:hypothetical protein
VTERLMMVSREQVIGMDPGVILCRGRQAASLIAFSSSRHGHDHARLHHTPLAGGALADADLALDFATQIIMADRAGRPHARVAVPTIATSDN